MSFPLDHDLTVTFRDFHYRDHWCFRFIPTVVFDSDFHFWHPFRPCQGTKGCQKDLRGKSPTGPGKPKMAHGNKRWGHFQSCPPHHCGDSELSMHPIVLMRISDNRDFLLWVPEHSYGSRTACCRINVQTIRPAFGIPACWSVIMKSNLLIADYISAFAVFRFTATQKIPHMHGIMLENQ